MRHSARPLALCLVILAAAGGCKRMTARSQERADSNARPDRGYQPDGNAPRSQVPDPFKWDLSPLVKNDAAFANDLARVRRDIQTLAAYRGQLADANKLKACLDLYFRLRLACNKLTLYGNMRFDSHVKDSRLQAMNDRALSAFQNFMAAATFIRDEVLTQSDEALAAAYSRVPELAEYRPYLDGLRRRRARVLSAEAERILSLAGDNLWAEIDINELPSDHEKTFRAVRTDLPLPAIRDETGKDVQLTLSNFTTFRASPNRRVRQEAFDGLFQSLTDHRHALAATLAGQFNFNIFLARARGYDSALAAYLDKDNIEVAVYHNLVTTIRNNLRPLHEYVRLRQEVLDLDELRVHDLYNPMVKKAAITVPYQEAQKILPRALAPLGSSYVALLNRGLDPKNGWVDLYPHADKASGAFAAATYGTHPYIKMNYYNKIHDLSVLAHEFGHAIHSQMAMDHQPYLTFNYSPFLAEIASTINEKLLSDYLVAHAESDAQRVALLAELLETIRVTIYRQALFAEFELRAHTAAEEGTPLTAEFFGDLYRKLVRDYYGPAFTMGEKDHIEWAYIPHFYYKYYVFSYATGLSAGIALADLITKGKKPAREAYLGMLKGGSSAPPLALLESAGVDLTKPAAIEAATRLMGELVGQIRLLRQKGGT